MEEPMKNLIKVAVVLMAVSMLTGCAEMISFEQAAHMEKVGFWHGLWHGMIAPISFIISLFNPNVAVYAIYNSGGWYDFGFLLGVGALTGGSVSAKK
jgi:hypothetical protein